MFPLNHINNSPIISTINIISTSSIYHLLNSHKKQKRQQDITTTITTTSLFSNITSLSSSTSTTQDPQISFEESSYSAKTGIKTAALLGGMLLLVIIYLLWKSRSRLCRHRRFSSAPHGNSRISATKFDLDYWLNQVDLLEAKEAERNRECLSPYLELPHEEPRNNQAATASWIVDTWRQWRLSEYRQQHPLLRQRTNQETELNPIPYRRRRRLLRRFIRRLLIPSEHRPSFSLEQSPSLIAHMRPSIVNNNLIPPPETLDIQPRRVASWPRLKSIHHRNGTMMSALQTQNARKRLLKRTSRTTTFGI